MAVVAVEGESQNQVEAHICERQRAGRRVTRWDNWGRSRNK